MINREIGCNNRHINGLARLWQSLQRRVRADGYGSTGWGAKHDTKRVLESYIQRRSTMSRASYSSIRCATVCVISCVSSRYMDSTARSSAIGKYRSWHSPCNTECYSAYSFRVTKWPCFMGGYEFRPHRNSADWVSGKASTTTIRWRCHPSNKMKSCGHY